MQGYTYGKARSAFPAELNVQEFLILPQRCLKTAFIFPKKLLVFNYKLF